MTSGKKRRMSILDTLAAAGGPASVPPSPVPEGAMMASNGALRSARDAVDAHHVWDLDPAAIDDERPTDRLDPDDIADLRASIEANGQTVPILVRRRPDQPDRYLLIYGRRRLEAIRRSDRISKVRALVASMDDDAAMRAQISENVARRELSFIERALFAKLLISNGFGNQSQIAEVLTASKSAVSMALGVVDAVGVDLARAIGPAHGIGRPRWEALAHTIDEAGGDREKLVVAARTARLDAARAHEGGEGSEDPSVVAFEAVVHQVTRPVERPAAKTKQPLALPLRIEGVRAGSVRRTSKGLNIEIERGAFADWLEAEAQIVIEELHTRWSRRDGD